VLHRNPFVAGVLDGCYIVCCIETHSSRACWTAAHGLHSEEQKSHRRLPVIQQKSLIGGCAWGTRPRMGERHRGRAACAWRHPGGACVREGPAHAACPLVSESVSAAGATHRRWAAPSPPPSPTPCAVPRTSRLAARGNGPVARGLGRVRTVPAASAVDGALTARAGRFGWASMPSMEGATYGAGPPCRGGDAARADDVRLAGARLDCRT
jgi:hypothetical protein